ncbi:glycosyltransferase family 9 protein, partial [Caminibacter sp.]
PGGGVNKHSEMKSRRWVSEYFNEVIENLPYKVILVGAGDSDELIAKSITSKNAINLINKTTFDETALILKKSLFYFGNDSAILFLAASQGIPTLGIFGPTQPEAATPIGDKQYFIKSKVSCSPCYNPYEGLNSIAYRCDSVECMQDIKPEEVLKKILEILGKENESK